MSSAHVLKARIGFKKILLHNQAKDNWSALCWCYSLARMVRVRLTGRQVEQLLASDSRNIDEVLPDTPPALREIFLTGFTPAELDEARFSRLRPRRDYAQMGYLIEPSELEEYADEPDFMPDDPARWDDEY